jgi:hypothetical protein
LKTILSATESNGTSLWFVRNLYFSKVTQKASERRYLCRK